MGISKVKIENFKTISRMQLNLEENGIICLLGKNGAGKTTIINAINYLYKIAEQPYKIEQVIDRKNPYVQKTIIELFFDFSKVQKKTTNQYIEENLLEFEKYIKNYQLPLKMIQYKNGLIEWYPINDVYKVRKLLKIFPLYFIDARRIPLHEWSDLWEIVSDLAISGIEQDSSYIKNNLTNLFKDIYGEKYTKAINIVENIFQEESITINDREYKKRFKNAVISNFGGEIFKIKEQNIDYYSDGINSLKYMTVFLKLVINLSKTAWKDITIIFDEPEISLHPQYIEALSDNICELGCNNAIIMSTHSNHLISSLIRNYSNIYFFQVYNNNGYAKIKKINDFFEEKDKYLIGDEESSSYFSDLTVLVEGQTEIQLFKNKRINEIYPFLKRATFYNTKSNDSVTKLMLMTGKSTVKFLKIVDMDKILHYTINKFNFRSGNKVVNPVKDINNEKSERYLYYGEKKKNTYIQSKKINTLIKSEIVAEMGNICLKGNNYTSLIYNIKKYCSVYNCFPFRTTVEGAIICFHSINIILEWIKINWEQKKYKEFIDDISIYNENIQVVIIRCIFHGKVDTLETEIKNEQVCKIVNKYSKGDKVDGWILEFFNWYFDKYMINDVEANKEKFACDFPEINDILHIIESMLK